MLDQIVDRVDWKTVAAELDEVGMASLGTVLRPAQCRSLAKLYDHEHRVVRTGISAGQDARRRPSSMNDAYRSATVSASGRGLYPSSAAAFV